MGNPVYVQTGDKLAQELDYESAGPTPLQLLRKYSLHSGGYSNSFGARWSSIVDRKVLFASDGDARVMVDGGYFVEFNKSGSAFTAKSAGVEGAFVEIDSATWEYRDPYGEVSTFVATAGGARLVSVRYANGYNMTMSGGLKITSITDSFGRTLNLTWDGDHVITVTAPGGVTLNYAYQTVVLPAAAGGSGASGSGQVDAVPGSMTGLRLVSVTKTVSGVSGSQVRQYHYEDPTTLYALTGITDERGVRISTYDYAFHRVVESEGPSGTNHFTYTYDLLNNHTTVTDALGKARVYDFSLVGGRMLLTSVAEQTATNSPAGTSTLGYSGTDKRLSSTQDQEGRTTTFTRNSAGQETGRTEASGTGVARTRSITWHTSSPQPTEIVEPGRTTTFTYQATSVGNGGGGGGADAHRYWRLKFVSNVAGSGNVGIGEAEFRTNLGGVNLLAGATLTSSTVVNSQPAALAADAKYGVNANSYDSAHHNFATSVMTGYLAADLGSATAVNQVALTGAESTYATGNPKEFNVQYSDVGGANDADWTTAWSVTNQTGWGHFERRVFTRPGHIYGGDAGSPHGAHRYWRVLMLNSVNPYYAFGLSEVEFRATPGGSDMTSGGAPIESGHYDATTVPANAFDNSNTSIWGTPGWGGASNVKRNHYIGYDFGAGNPKVVAEVMLRSRGDGSSAERQAPNLWMLQYSDDNSTWTTAARFSDDAAWGVGESRTYTDPLYVP